MLSDRLGNLGCGVILALIVARGMLTNWHDSIVRLAWFPGMGSLTGMVTWDVVRLAW